MRARALLAGLALVAAGCTSAVQSAAPVADPGSDGATASATPSPEPASDSTATPSPEPTGDPTGAPSPGADVPDALVGAVVDLDGYGPLLLGSARPDVEALLGPLEEAPCSVQLVAADGPRNVWLLFDGDALVRVDVFASFGRGGAVAASVGGVDEGTSPTSAVELLNEAGLDVARDTFAGQDGASDEDRLVAAEGEVRLVWTVNVADELSRVRVGGADRVDPPDLCV